jgi:serine/threonine-protein kinase
MARSLGYFREAIEREPGYALAHAALAEAYVIQAVHGVQEREEGVRLAKASAARALDLDPHLAEGHTVRGMIACTFDWAWEEAEEAFRRAIALSPGSSVARLEFSDFLCATDRIDQALAQALEAQRLDPLSAAPTHWVAFCLLCLADYDGAIREFRKALALYPHWVWGWIKMSRAYAEKGSHAEAIEAARRAEVESGGKTTPLAKSWLAHVYAHSGDPDRARTIEAALLQPPDGVAVDPVILAEVHVSRGDDQAAVACLEQAYRERSSNLYFAKLLPRLYRNWPTAHPTFRSLLERMRLT